MRWPFSRIPELGRHLPSNYDQGEKLFDERVKAHFPIGMSEPDLIETLQKQGFRINSYDSIECKSATFEKGVVLRTVWSVRWREREGRISEIWGVYGGIAP